MQAAEIDSKSLTIVAFKDDGDDESENGTS